MLVEVMQDLGAVNLLLWSFGKHAYSPTVINVVDVVLVTTMVVLYHAVLRNTGYNKLQYYVHCFILLWIPSCLSLLDWQVAWQVWPVPSAILLFVTAAVITITMLLRLRLKIVL